MHGRIYLIRHGQFGWQENKSLGLDSALTNIGELQSMYLSMHLQKLLEGQSVHVLSSSLRRAIQTRDFFLQSHKLVNEATETTFLKEAPFHLASNDGTEGAKPSEMYKQFYRQVVAGFLKLIAGLNGKTVLCFTHNGVIKCILREIYNDEQFNTKVRNASITAIDIAKGSPSITFIDDVYDLPHHLRTN